MRRRPTMDLEVRLCWSRLGERPQCKGVMRPGAWKLDGKDAI